MKIGCIIVDENITEITKSYSCTKSIWLTNTPPRGYTNIKSNINYVANDQYSSLNNVIIYPYLSSMFEVDGVKYVPTNPSKRTCDVIDFAFANLQNLLVDSVVLYKGIAMTVKEIMPYSFYQKSDFKTLKISNSGNIGDNAFYGCIKLNTLILGKGVKSIENSTFEGCSSLKDIVIPNSVTSLGDSCFSGCSKLSTIKLGNSLNIIKSYTFQNCTSLQEIIIPPSVKQISDYAFVGCKKMSDFIIKDRNSVLKLGSNGNLPIFNDCPLDSVYIGGKIIYNTAKAYGYSPFYRNTSLYTVVISDREEQIYENEFYGCSNLKNVRIGNDVTSIGNWAFSGCSSLNYFTFGNKVSSIAEEAFSDCI